MNQISPSTSLNGLPDARHRAAPFAWPSDLIWIIKWFNIIARGSRKDRWKYVWTRNHDDLLFDMAADPQELNDLSGDPTHSEVKAELRGRLLGRYDVEAVTARAAVSKRTRTFLHNTLSTNDGHRWDYQPVFDAATAYVRGTNDPGTA